MTGSNVPYLFPDDLRLKLKLYLSIGLGMFLFILFFQPFELSALGFNNRLLVIAGFGAITFIILCLMHIVLPRLAPELFIYKKWNVNSDVITNISILLLNSVAYAFYDIYVGLVSVSMYLMFKIVVLSTAPVITLIIYNKYRYLKQKVKHLDDNINPPGPGMSSEDSSVVEFDSVSDNRINKINLSIRSIMFLRSADNYVDIFYKENDLIKRVLIRNTLKNIEDKLKLFPSIIRCHRSYIVNIKHILDLISNKQGLKLKLIDCEQDIPVSRQYLLFVREAMKNISR